MQVRNNNRLSNVIYNYKKAAKGALTGLLFDKLSLKKIEINNKYPLLKNKLGKTSLSVSILGLGGQAVVEQRFWSNRIEQILNKAIDIGINYIDTSPDYGKSQYYIGKFLRNRRPEFILATKTRACSYDEIMVSVENTLKELKTDYIEVMQIHCLDSEDCFNNLFRGMRPGFNAFRDLKEQQIVHYIGASSSYITDYILKAIKLKVLDMVLLPVNPADVHENSYISSVLPVARQEGLGVIGSEVLASGRLMKYAPAISINEALSYALSQDVDGIVVGVDSLKQLEENVKYCSEFKFMSPDDQKKIEYLTSRYYNSINRFKNHKQRKIS